MPIEKCPLSIYSTDFFATWIYAYLTNDVDKIMDWKVSMVRNFFSFV